VHIHRDPPAVVNNRDTVVNMKRHMDIVTLSGHGLINGVVHDLVD